MRRLRRCFLTGPALVSLLLVLVAGTCGSADVVSAHAAHGHDVRGAPSHAHSCVSVVPPAADQWRDVAPDAAVPAPAIANITDFRALVAVARPVPHAATDPPRFLLHSALLI